MQCWWAHSSPHALKAPRNALNSTPCPAAADSGITLLQCTLREGDATHLLASCEEGEQAVKPASFNAPEKVQAKQHDHPGQGPEEDQCMVWLRALTNSVPPAQAAAGTERGCGCPIVTS